MQLIVSAGAAGLTLSATQAYSGPERDILVDVGTGDSNKDGQLKPEALEQAAKGNSHIKLDLRLQARRRRTVAPACLLLLLGLTCAAACRPTMATTMALLRL